VATEFARTGIAGFDAATGGGIPKGSRTILYGPPGTGKSVFAMQFLWTGLNAGERVAWNAADRPFTQVRRYFHSFGWDLSAHEAEGRMIALQSFPHFEGSERAPAREASEPAEAEHFQAYDLGAMREATQRLSNAGVTRFVSGDHSQAIFSLQSAAQMVPIADWLVHWVSQSTTTLLEIVTATQMDVEGYKNWSLSLKAAHNILQFRIQGGRREIRILKMERADHPLEWVPIAIGARGIEMGIA